VGPNRGHEVELFWRRVIGRTRELSDVTARARKARDVAVADWIPKDHREKIHSINPLERLNGEIKRRTDVVGIFPNEGAITRLVGALLLEQNDEWALQRGPKDLSRP